MFLSSMKVLPWHSLNIRETNQKLLLTYLKLQEKKADSLEGYSIQARERSKETSLLRTVQKPSFQ